MNSERINNITAIMAADEKKDIVIWLDADNNEVQLTIEELEIVFKAAWRAQQAVWFIPKDPPKEEKEK